MREAHDGALLFTTGATALNPDALADRWYRLAQARGTFETTVGI